MEKDVGERGQNLYYPSSLLPRLQVDICCVPLRSQPCRVAHPMVIATATVPSSNCHLPLSLRFMGIVHYSLQKMVQHSCELYFLNAPQSPASAINFILALVVMLDMTWHSLREGGPPGCMGWSWQAAPSHRFLQGLPQPQSPPRLGHALLAALTWWPREAGKQAYKGQALRPDAGQCWQTVFTPELPARVVRLC